jgi:hypothetical protein
MLAASNTLPDNAGYVVAAYLVFLALVLIYVAIMAYKLARIGREVAELHELADAEDSRRALASERELAQGLARTAGGAHE